MAYIFKAKYEEHDAKLSCEFKKWYQNGTYVDVTVHAGGECIEAHKLVLAANSPFFNGIFQDAKRENSELFFTDVPYQSMKSLIEYMYSGELVVDREFLPACLQLADSLKVRGISGLNYDEIITEPVPVSAKMQNFINNIMLQMMPPVERKKKLKNYNGKRIKNKKIGKCSGNRTDNANRNTISRLIFKKNKISGGYSIKKVNHSVRKNRKHRPKDQKGNLDTSINGIIEADTTFSIQKKQKFKQSDVATDFTEPPKKLKKLKAGKRETRNSEVVQKEEDQHTLKHKQKIDENEDIGVYKVSSSAHFFNEEILNSNVENHIESFLDSQHQPSIYYESTDDNYKNLPYFEPPNNDGSFQTFQLTETHFEEGQKSPKSTTDQKQNCQYQAENKLSPAIEDQFEEPFVVNNNLEYDYNYEMKNPITEFPTEQYEKLSPESIEPSENVPLVEMKSNSDVDDFDEKSAEQNEKNQDLTQASIADDDSQKRVTICPQPVTCWKNNRIHFSCTLCQRSYTHKSNYRRHYMVFHKRCEEAVFQCPLCDKKFTRSDNRGHHIRRIHKVDNTGTPCDEKRTSFICPLCEKSFTRNYNRTLHIKVIHGIADPVAVLTNML